MSTYCVKVAVEYHQADICEDDHLQGLGPELRVLVYVAGGLSARLVPLLGDVFDHSGCGLFSVHLIVFADT